MPITPIQDLEYQKFLITDDNEVFVKVTGGHNGVVDSSNSSHIALLADEVFTGEPVNILPYSIIYVTVFSDQASATDGLVIEQGHKQDSTYYWDSSDEYTIPASKGKTFSIQPALEYLRVRYTNGSVDQTEFRLHVNLKYSNGLESSHRIQDSIVDDDDSRLVKAVLTAKSDSNGYINIQSTASNNLKVTDAESGLAIAKGDVSNTTFIHKFGNAPDFDPTDGYVNVWDGANDATINAMQYTYSSTADITRLSSSNNADTQEVEIIGLDANWIENHQHITLTGQTPVNLVTPLIRVFRIKNVDTTNIAGILYCYTSAATVTAGVPTPTNTIRAAINNGNNQTLMAIYTIPAGKTGYMRDWYASTSGAKRSSSHIIRVVARPFGSVFQIKHIASINDSGTSYIQHNYEEPEVFAEKTDIHILVNTDQDTAGVSAGFDIVLIDN